MASPSPVSMALTDATEIIVSTPGAISSAARSSAGVTGWWACTRSPSPFQWRSASSRSPLAPDATGGAYANVRLGSAAEVRGLSRRRGAPDLLGLGVDALVVGELD